MSINLLHTFFFCKFFIERRTKQFIFIYLFCFKYKVLLFFSFCAANHPKKKKKMASQSTIPPATTTNVAANRSFLDAINERYGAADDSNAYSDDAFNVGDITRAASSKKNSKKWEMVGMDAAREKQSNHSRLSVLGLQSCDICTAEKSCGQIVAAGLKRVRELNLSDNENLSAADIDTIISALPSLVELQLSGTGVGNASLWSPQLGELASSAAANGGSSSFNLLSASTSSVDENTNTNNTNQQQSRLFHQQQLESPLAASTNATDFSSSTTTTTATVRGRPQSPFRHNNWTRLTTLALNRCGMTWDNLLEAFPCNLVSLVSLHLESNHIDKIYPPTLRRTPSQQHRAMQELKQQNADSGAENAGAVAAPDSSSPLCVPCYSSSAATSTASFAPMFPALRELNLSFNEITTLDQDPSMLDFFKNDTPQLSSLNLTGNKIVIKIAHDDDNTATDAPKEGQQQNEALCYISRLEVLYLTQNAPLVSASSCSSFSSSCSSSQEEPLVVLNWLRVRCPKLKSLRISYDDLFGDSSSSSSCTVSPSNSGRPKSFLSEVQQRSLVIAAMPQVESLNSGPVRAKERMDAEMLYLQVAKARKEQQEKQQKQVQQIQVQDSTTTSSSLLHSSASAGSTSANRFFPWRFFPLLDHLAEKHKNVVLSSLNQADGGSKKGTSALNGLASGCALSYTLRLTFRVLSETTKQHDSSSSSSTILQQIGGGGPITTTASVAMAEDVTKTVPGNMTVGKLRSFVAAIYPSIASLAQQKRLQAHPNDCGIIPAIVLAHEDDENPLILCGVPSSAVVEIFV